MVDKNHEVIFWNRDRYALESIYTEKWPYLADMLLDNAIDEIDPWYGKKPVNHDW